MLTLFTCYIIILSYSSSRFSSRQMTGYRPPHLHIWRTLLHCLPLYRLLFLLLSNLPHPSSHPFSSTFYSPSSSSYDPSPSSLSSIDSRSPYLPLPPCSFPSTFTVSSLLFFCLLLVIFSPPSWLCNEIKDYRQTSHYFQ